MRNKVIWIVFVVAVIIVAWSLVHRSENQPLPDTTVAPEIERAAQPEETMEEASMEMEGEMMEGEEMMHDGEKEMMEEAPAAE